jgi:hypothetical protein
MVSTSEHGKPKKGENEEIEEAQEAKEAADPAINDPKYMPNIIPQTGEDGGTADAAEVADPDSEENPDNPVNHPQATNPPPAKTGFEEREESDDGSDDRYRPA